MIDLTYYDEYLGLAERAGARAEFPLHVEPPDEQPTVGDRYSVKVPLKDFADPAIEIDAQSYLDQATPGISPSIRERYVVRIAMTICSIALLAAGGLAQTPNSPAQFPAYMSDNFDYAAFTRFDAQEPPRDQIYQSNGFMAMQETGFGGQTVIVPVAGPEAPVNEGERLSALALDSPVFIDASGHKYALGESTGRHNLTYFADRTVYRAAFENGLQVTVTAYPVYGRSCAVYRITVDRTAEPVTVLVRMRGLGFQTLPDPGLRAKNAVSYGSARWPYRLLVGADARARAADGSFHWLLNAGGTASVTLALGKDDREAKANLAALRAAPDLFDAETHRQWNEYLASAPLVAPAEPIRFTIGTLNRDESISPEELVRSELWFWRGLLNTTCQARYLAACPMTIADWNVFMGMWSNDGIAEAIALMGTNRADLARSSILSWFRYAVNAEGDGTAAWTIFPSGKNTFQATGPERQTQGVPVQATLLGEYVRLTGDRSILEEKPGGAAGGRTVWQALLAYQQNLLKVRDPNHDHLIDWTHTYETGWDDKDSPFFDLKGDATSSINEQVFNLWSLQEMVYLSKLQGEDPAPWEEEFERARKAVRKELWDPATRRYEDLDVKTGKLWTQGENLDAYYLLYFETDPVRIETMMKRLNDPAKFNGPMLPALAFDTPNWGGYWRGEAWPRIYGYVAMGLARSGHGLEGFNWLARAIHANDGPILPEHVDPKLYPPSEHPMGSVRIMGYDALDTLLFPELAGLHTWAGDDLIVTPNPKLGKVYVRNQKWLGDRYDAVFEPNMRTLIMRNGKALPSLGTGKIWYAHKTGNDVVFETK
jgi:hypothetical protein